MLRNRKQGLEEENRNLRQELQELDRRYTLQEEEIKRLRHEKEELKRALDEAEQFSRTESADVAVVASPDDAPAALPEGGVCYYLQPSAESRFKESSKVRTEADALYKLWYQGNNPEEAYFLFIDSPDNVYLSVQNEQTWILVACERSNIPTDNTRSIRTDTPGKAVWRNGEWEILQKAKITYL